MVCKNCGSNLDEGAVFCANCGTSVENVVNNDSLNNNIVNDVTNNGFESSSNSSNNKSTGNLKNALIILLVCALIFVGAYFLITKVFNKSSNSSNTKNIENIEYAINNMADISQYENFDFKFNFDLAATEYGETISVKAGLDSTIDLKNKMARLNLSADADDMSFSLPVYLDLNDTMSIYAKIPMQDVWYKLFLGDYVGDLDDIDFTESNEQNIGFEEFLDSENFAEKVSSDMDGADKYVLHFSKEILAKLAEEDSEFDFSMIEEYGLDEGFDVNLYINKKDNYVTKMSFDFSGKTFEGVTFDRFIFSMELTNLNSADSIVVPSDALNAVDFTESDLYESLIEEFGNLVSGLDYSSDLFEF